MTAPDGLTFELAHLRACADAIPVNPGAFDLEVLMPRYASAVAAVERVPKLIGPPPGLPDEFPDTPLITVIRCDEIREAITAALARETENGSAQAALVKEDEQP